SRQPAACALAWQPRMRSRLNGLDRLGRTSAIVPAESRSAASGSTADSYPISRALRAMRSYIGELTRLGFESARDTVDGATPQAWAISVSVTRRRTRRTGMATALPLRLGGCGVSRGDCAPSH